MLGYSTVLELEEYKDKKNLIVKFEAAYGSKKYFKLAIEMLSSKYEREFTAFCKYFGYNYKPMTLRAIGEEMNISNSRVGQLSRKAFRVLIHPKYRNQIWEKHGYKAASENI